jgi:hypothetical protein
MQCKVCKREAETSHGLCRHHSEARDALKSGYKRWQEAYSDISWGEYLNRVKALDETGRWIKEVISVEEAGL